LDKLCLEKIVFGQIVFGQIVFGQIVFGQIVFGQIVFGQIVCGQNLGRKKISDSTKDCRMSASRKNICFKISQRAMFHHSLQIGGKCQSQHCKNHSALMESKTYHIKTEGGRKKCLRGPGLPDGILSNRKIQIWVNFGGSWNRKC
jgi:hypothetical protein